MSQTFGSLRSAAICAIFLCTLLLEKAILPNILTSILPAILPATLHYCIYYFVIGMDLKSVVTISRSEGLGVHLGYRRHQYTPAPYGGALRQLPCEHVLTRTRGPALRGVGSQA